MSGRTSIYVITRKSVDALGNVYLKSPMVVEARTATEAMGKCCEQFQVNLEDGLEIIRASETSFSSAYAEEPFREVLRAGKKYADLAERYDKDHYLTRNALHMFRRALRLAGDPDEGISET
jgi:hypothetical protein